jgi:cell wall-associated NlpC family hydrolase
MGAHSARHRGAPGTTGIDQHRTVHELIAMAAQAQPPTPPPARAVPAPPAADHLTPLPAPGPVPPLPAEGRVPRPRSPRAVPPRVKHGVPSPRGPRSAFAVVAASAVGAGTAAVSMSGAFAAVTPAPARELGDTQSFARPAVQPVDLAATSGGVTTASAAPATFTALPATATAPAAAVMAADLHQTDAQQIADLSRAVNLSRAQAAVSNTVSAVAHGAVAPLFDASPLASKALSRAMSKMGVPYVWGAVGPNAFDCSGLVMWSYKQQGINLPRTAAAQSQVGNPVSRSQLRPGDLVFFYSPVSHVGIYVGNNKILNASESGKPVKISSMANMPFHNARRIT